VKTTNTHIRFELFFLLIWLNCGKNGQTIIYKVASQHERNYIPWNFLMQPAVRACVQSIKRAETAKGSRHCNITEFFEK